MIGPVIKKAAAEIAAQMNSDNKADFLDDPKSWAEGLGMQWPDHDTGDLLDAIGEILESGERQMTAGKIKADWLAGARSNEGGGGTVEDWFAAAGNWSSVSIDDEGSVWVDLPSRGHWLSQEVIDRACKKIDEGL